jgi:hypothetical protein
VDYQDGIDEITDRFTLKDTSQPHPFRPELRGRPTIYFVVSDSEGELLRKPGGEYYVRSARSFGGLVNLRRQVGRYHYPPEEEGKPVGQMRPRKIDDDLVDDLRAFATHRWPPKPMLNEHERLRVAMPSLKRIEEKAEEQGGGVSPEDEFKYFFDLRVAEKKAAASGPQVFDEWGTLEG